MLNTIRPVSFCPQTRVPACLSHYVNASAARAKKSKCLKSEDRTLINELKSSVKRELSANGAISQTRVCVFSAQQYVKDHFEATLTRTFARTKLLEARLSVESAKLAAGSDAVVIFVNDDCSAEVVDELADVGVRMIALRCAGFDRVDLQRCKERGIKVARVPTYSPESVAEHAATLITALCRNIVQAHQRVASGNFALSGLTGMEIHGKTVGVIGTGAIGKALAKIMLGFGCNILAFDLREDSELKQMGVTYAPLEDILPQADILSLHVPLLPSTRNMLDKTSLAKLKRGAIVVNVSRGGLVDTQALVEALLEGQVGAAGLDVYAQEGELFFKDTSTERLAQRLRHWDRKFAELISLPNVLVTPHVAFLTQEALQNIADTTVANLRQFAQGEDLTFEVKA